MVRGHCNHFSILLMRRPDSVSRTQTSELKRSVPRMKFLTRHKLAWLFLLSCSSFLVANSQTPEKKTSTLTGTVTIKGRAAPDLTMVVRSPRNRSEPQYVAKTNQEGKYEITGIAPGTYEVRPDSPVYVVNAPAGNATFIIGEGETVDGVNFSLTKGGVITGRITNSEGQPLIEQNVFSNISGSNRYPVNLNMGGVARFGSTDDRGIYRIFGLPPGKYIVGVTAIPGGPSRSGIQPSRTTWHPGVSESSKATVIELSEGSEATNVDISVETDDDTPRFSASGQIVDGINGQPVPGLQLGLYSLQGQSPRASLIPSNAEGQFKIEGLSAGRYGFYIDGGNDGGLRIEMPAFEIIDGNVSGLVVKTFKGASIFGQIVFEGNEKKSLLKIEDFGVIVSVANQAGSTGKNLEVAPDGRFQVRGLPEGTAQFSINSYRGPRLLIGVSRVEREGVLQTAGLVIKDGEQVNGVKIVINGNAGTIRGVVKIDNSEVTPDQQVYVWLSADDPTRIGAQSTLTAQVDSRGHFVFESVPAGTYEVNASVNSQGATRKIGSTKQMVSVSEGGVSQVTLMIDLSPRP